MSGKRMGTLRLIWLEAFVEVVDRGSYTDAANAIGCDQGSITRYIAQLGEWLGPPLTHTGTAELTSAGERLLPTAREVVRLLGEARVQNRSVRPSPTPVSAKDLRV